MDCEHFFLIFSGIVDLTIKLQAIEVLGGLTTTWFLFFYSQETRSTQTIRKPEHMTDGGQGDKKVKGGTVRDGMRQVGQVMGEDG